MYIIILEFSDGVRSSYKIHKVTTELTKEQVFTKIKSKHKLENIEDYGHCLKEVIVKDISEIRDYYLE